MKPLAGALLASLVGACALLVLAVVALSIERLEAERARERQEAGANQHRSLVEIVPQGSDPGKARDAAAAVVGVELAR